MTQVTNERPDETTKDGVGAKEKEKQCFKGGRRESERQQRERQRDIKGHKKEREREAGRETVRQ